MFPPDTGYTQALLPACKVCIFLGSYEERAQPPGLLLLPLLNICRMNGSREEEEKQACYSLVLGVFKALKEEREECENREQGAYAGLRWPLSPSRWLHLMALCRGAP